VLTAGASLRSADQATTQAVLLDGSQQTLSSCRTCRRCLWPSTRTILQVAVCVAQTLSSR
jgi:hypothetical protein